MNTQFTYEETKYVVNAEVCNHTSNVIQLPDCRYLRVTAALESLPPQIEEVEETTWDESLNVFEAVVAE
jgi:hypothetical protein